MDVLLQVGPFLKSYYISVMKVLLSPLSLPLQVDQTIAPVVEESDRQTYWRAQITIHLLVPVLSNIRSVVSPYCGFDCVIAVDSYS